MSVAVDLEDVKAALRVIHDSDDQLLTRLIGSATRECLAFLDCDALPIEADSESATVTVPEDVFNGIVLMVQSDYEGDPLKRNDMRTAAESLWFPYRRSFGP